MIIKAPNSYVKRGRAVFLSGAIDMGQAVDWQKRAEAALDSPELIILNPRRDGWDDTWVQEKTDPQFSRQVRWELEGLTAADIVLVVFTKDSKAPITFLELGLFARKCIVCVEPGFYRKGNVDIVCEHLSIPVFEDFDEAIAAVKMNLDALKWVDLVKSLIDIENNTSQTQTPQIQISNTKGLN